MLATVANTSYKMLAIVANASYQMLTLLMLDNVSIPNANFISPQTGNYQVSWCLQNLDTTRYQQCYTIGSQISLEAGTIGQN